MKPLPAKLVRSGHCVHVPALGSSSDDANLVNALLEDIEKLISDIEVKQYVWVCFFCDCSAMVITSFHQFSRSLRFFVPLRSNPGRQVAT